MRYDGHAKGGWPTLSVGDLPKMGVAGNTHMLMMDKNSDQVAAMLQKWMADKGLMH